MPKCPHKTSDGKSAWVDLGCSQVLGEPFFRWPDGHFLEWCSECGVLRWWADKWRYRRPAWGKG